MKHYRADPRAARRAGRGPRRLRRRWPTATARSTSTCAACSTTVERVAAGPFAREAIAEVRNAQFIALCERPATRRRRASTATSIQPEEVAAPPARARACSRSYCTTPELQELAAAAARNTLAIADELRTLAEKATGMHPIPSPDRRRRSDHESIRNRRRARRRHHGARHRPRRRARRLRHRALRRRRGGARERRGVDPQEPRQGRRARQGRRSRRARRPRSAWRSTPTSPRRSPTPTW